MLGDFMQGIVLINKEKDMTSFDVVKRIQRNTHLKVGHTGTLDPQATGVLVCLVNNTKVLSFLDMSTKTYRAQLSFGKRTDTLDIWGEVLEEKDITPFTEQQVIEVLNSFVGSTKQIVPIVSAKKIKGKKLYEYHRENKEVVQPVIDIEISSIHLLSITDESIEFEVTVSSGTYIRALCENIAEKLNNIGTMSSLVRLRCGIFKLEDCHLLDEVISDLSRYLIDVKEGLKHLPFIEIDDPTYVYHGKALDYEYVGDMAVVIYQEQALAVIEYKETEGKYRIVRGLWV